MAPVPPPSNHTTPQLHCIPPTAPGPNGAACDALFCDAYVPFNVGRTGFRVHQGVQGGVGLILLLITTERIARLLRYRCCSASERVGSVQLVAFCLGFFIAAAEVVDAVDPDGWCGVLPFSFAAVLQDVASAACMNACALIMYSYFTVLAAVRAVDDGLGCCASRREHAMRPCRINCAMWFLMGLIALLIGGVSAAINLSGVVAMYAIGSGVVMPLVMTALILMLEGLLLCFGCRVSVTLSEMLHSLRGATSHAVTAQRRSLGESNHRTIGAPPPLVSASSRSLPQLARFGSDEMNRSGQLAGRWLDMEESEESEGAEPLSWDRRNNDDRGVSSSSGARGRRRSSGTRRRGGMINSNSSSDGRTRHKSSIRLPDSDEARELASQIGRLHASLVITAVLTVGALAYFTVLFYRGSLVLQGWRAGDCTHPFCDFDAVPHVTQRLKLYAYLSLLAPAILRLCVATAMVFIFFRIPPPPPPPPASSDGSGGGGGGRGGVGGVTRERFSRGEDSGAWAFEAETSEEDGGEIGGIHGGLGDSLASGGGSIRSGWQTADSSYHDERQTAGAGYLAGTSLGASGASQGTGAGSNLTGSLLSDAGFHTASSYSSRSAANSRGSSLASSLLAGSPGGLFDFTAAAYSYRSTT